MHCLLRHLRRPCLDSAFMPAGTVSKALFQHLLRAQEDSIRTFPRGGLLEDDSAQSATEAFHAVSGNSNQRGQLRETSNRLSTSVARHHSFSRSNGSSCCSGRCTDLCRLSCYTRPLLASMTAMMQQNQQPMQQLATTIRPASTPVASTPASDAHDPAGLIRSTILKNALPDPAAILGFWDAFVYRVDRSSLNDVDKYEALRCLLSGSALKKLGAFDGYQPNDYAEACRVLQANYSNTSASNFGELEEFTDALRLATGQLLRLGELACTLDSDVYALWSRLPLELQSEIRNLRASNRRLLLLSCLAATLLCGLGCSSAKKTKYVGCFYGHGKFLREGQKSKDMTVEHCAYLCTAYVMLP
uniref:Uncharacterized protein n=1 Tax=Macrostomum lignano TaxID=282301 RepID=A0A1I8HAS4_9PLAT